MGGGLRILYVLPYTPSPIRVRPYQIIRALARAGHQITVVALEDGFASKTTLQELKEVCDAVHIVPHSRIQAAANCLMALPTPRPLWAAYCHSPRMENLLRELVASGAYDVAHVEHLRAAHFASALGTLPRVLDAVDCITALRRQILDQCPVGPQKLLSYEEWLKLRRYEPSIYRSYSQVAVTSQQDAMDLATLAPERLPPIEVIPNGVDLEYFSPLTDVRSITDTITFSGKMSYIANEDAAQFLLKEIVPYLRKLRPQVEVILVGSNPSTGIRELAKKTGGITVTGYVEDLRPYLSRAVVAVCPMRIGVGIQNKALEAMAMGRPVVATPLAGRALAGAVRTGSIRLMENAEAFARACATLLANPNEATEAGVAARRYIEEHHRWEFAAAHFIELYEKARACAL
jgi:sugar transferase (PEP-CTERM/EpsH1 system associated)